MAKFKPIRIGDTVPLQQIQPATEEVDGKLYVSQSGVVLGRASAGDGPHEEILFEDLPGGPGGASYTEITYADMQTALSGGTLTPGGWYLITDATGTDLGFLTYAVTENQISVAGVGGYLNADFQAVGNYDGVEAITGVAVGTQQGIWRTSFEAITINYVNLQFPSDYVSYSTSSGLLDPAETFTTDLGTTGEVITDDGAGTVTVQNLSQALVAGEVITGDNSGNTVTVDSYTVTAKVFAVGDTITGGTTGATAVILTDDGAASMTAYMTSPGMAFDGSEVLDNGSGVTADQDGAASAPTIVLGDIVIWNLLHWQLTDDTALDGTDPATNTAAYTQLLKTDAEQGYITAWDVSEFDFPNAWLQYRADGRGNRIFLDFLSESNAAGTGTPATSVFQFGNDIVFSNICENGLIDNKNARCQFAFNVVMPFGQIFDIDLHESGAFRYNFVQQQGTIQAISLAENCDIANNYLYPEGRLENISGGVTVDYNILFNSTFMGWIVAGSGCIVSGNLVCNRAIAENIIIGDGTAIENNTLENGASLTGITAGSNCSISRNKIGQGATLGGSTTMGDGAAFDDLDIRANKQVSNKELDAGVTFSDKIVQLTTDEAETYSANVEGNRTQPGFSDIPGTIDITGLTTLDCTAAFAQYRGIYNLTSSNATESIDTITNPPTAFPFTLRPAAGLVLTVTGTAYAGIAAGQIALKATDYTLDGDKGEYIVLEIDPLGTGALIEKYVVNGII